MKRIIFNTKLTDDNKRLRNYVLNTIKKYKKPKNCSLIEIGIGNGRFGFLIGKRFKEYYGIEPDKKYLKIAEQTKPNKKFSYKLGRAEKIPFKEKFDIIFYSFSWHLIKDYDKALEEVKNILKDKGIILIIDPMENSRNWTDKKLVKGSKEFDEKRYKRKVKQIRRGIKKLKKQKIFKIVCEESGRINLWVLQKK